MYKKTVLKDNLRVILVPRKDTAAVTLLVLFGVGSRYENRRISGVSHFVEHLMFKGTKKRPNTLAISKELDGIGAEYNAFTSKDYTGYYIKADARHLALAVEVLSDMLLNSKFDSEEIEREKRVIIEEINMYEDNPMMYVEDLLEQTIYGDQPMGWSIAGWRKTVSALTRAEIIKYFKHHYHPKNAVVILAGQVDQKAVSLLAKKFKLIKAKKTKFAAVKLKQKIQQIKVLAKTTEQLQVALGFSAYAYNNPKLYALNILAVILGGNMSSRLFLSVRERQGLCYFIRASLNIYQDTGSLVIQAGLDKSRIKQALTLILSELVKIKAGVTLEELKRAKEFLRGKVALDLEDSSALAQFFGNQELLQGKIKTPAEKMAKLDLVTLKQVKAVAQEILVKNKLNLAVIGPNLKKQELEKIILQAKI